MSCIINGRCEFQVVPAFGGPNRLILKASNRSLSGLVDLDEDDVNKTEFAILFSIHATKNHEPKATSPQRRQRW